MLECIVTLALVGKGTKFRDICQLLGDLISHWLRSLGSIVLTTAWSLASAVESTVAAKSMGIFSDTFIPVAMNHGR